MVELDKCAISNETAINQIADILANPKFADNPLRKHLAILLDVCTIQQEKLQRLISISDGYHRLSKTENDDLIEQNKRQLRRLEKLARISDFYQNNLHKLNAKMEYAALVDVLTGLYNRRYLLSELGKLVSKTAQGASGFSLAMMDLDNFKIINDNYSHEIGDLALQAIAKTILSCIRDSDVCGRWGGEEFLIIFPNTNIDFASHVSSRILSNIEQLKLPKMDDLPLPHTTASIGLTNYHYGESYMDTVDRADLALHKAKNGSKNTLILLQ